jgi:hypothetical protein
MGNSRTLISCEDYGLIRQRQRKRAILSPAGNGWQESAPKAQNYTAMVDRSGIVCLGATSLRALFD